MLEPDEQSSPPLLEISAVGLLPLMWPSENVLLGMCVCRALREQLPTSCSGAVVVVQPGRPLPAVLQRLQCPIRISTRTAPFSAALLPSQRPIGQGSGPKIVLEQLYTCRDRIERLELRNCALASDNCKSIASLLETHHSEILHLQELDLGHNALGKSFEMPRDGESRTNDRWPPALFSSLAGLVYLRALNLSHNNLGFHGCKLLFEALGGPGSAPRLSMLNVDSNNFGDDGLRFLANAFHCHRLAGVSTQLPSLRVLSLGDNAIGDAGIACLVPVLAASCTQLGDLNLSRNLITDEGDRNISAMMRQRTQVRRLRSVWVRGSCGALRCVLVLR